LRKIFLLTVLAFAGTTLCFAETTVGEERALLLALEVTNGTANGHPVVGDEVTVEIYQHNKLLSTVRGKVGTDGRAIFENVPSGEHMVAVAKVFHDAMSFSSNSIGLKPTQQQVNAQVQVFDVSYDNSRLSVKTHHFMIKRQDSSILITEYIQLVNPSDLAISSDKRDSLGKAIVLTVPLPEGFKDFSSSRYFVLEALRFTEEGFYDTMAVPPGSHELLFTYALDVKSDTVDITKRISLPTSNLILFSELDRGMVQGLGESDGKMVLPNGTSAEYYKLRELVAGTEIIFKVVGLSTGVGQRGSWIILAVVFGAITIFAASRLWHAKRQSENLTGSS
jgi:hypothetical protein